MTGRWAAATPIGWAGMALANSDDLVGLLPHRPPFRFVDAVDAYQAGVSIVARYRVTGDEDFLAGHFPGNPIIPGAVLLDELVSAILPRDWTGEVEAAKFHHPVRPGDTVMVTHQTKGDSTRFECRLVEGEKLVMSGVLRAKFPSR